jgi:hypothetical protein
MSEGAETRLLPDDPNHRHYALYSHLLGAVTQVEPHRSPEQRANLAAGLLDAYLQSRPAAERELRLDETAIRSLQVVAGRPNAPVPSLFVISGAPREGTPLISTPLTTAGIAASETLAPYAQTRTIDQDGYLTDPGITRTAVPALERNPMTAVNCIVLHRTMGSTAAGTLNHWRSETNPYGTHFLIDRDGTIHQTASLNNNTAHVGRIRSRGEVEGTLTPEEQLRLNNMRAEPGNDFTAVNRFESAKPYPQRYPINADSIGIEVVATYDERTRSWQAPTEQQTTSIRQLVGILQQNYGLNDNDIYQHDVVSYKTQGEGAGLYQPHGDQPVDAGLQQPPAAGRSR